MLQSPWMLLGVGAAIFIALAHRLFRQPARKVQLSSLRLLPPSQDEPVAPRSWQDLALMALRLSLWTLLALALARPHCSVTRDIQVYEGPQAALVVVDAGARTHHRVQGTTLWEHTIQQSIDLIDALPSGSWIALTALEPTMTQVVIGPDKAQAKATLRAWEQAGKRGDLARQSALDLTAIQEPLAELGAQAPQSLPKVAYFIGEPGQGASTRCPQGDPQDPEGIRQWICIPSVKPDRIAPPGAQYAITDLTIDARKAEGGSTYALKAEIQNLGVSTPNNQELELQWFIDDRPMQRQRVTLTQGRGQARWYYGVPGTTPMRVRAQLRSADAFALDDKQERWLQKARPLQVLLVDGDPSEQREHDEVYLLATALQQAFKRRGISVRGIDPAQFQAMLEASAPDPTNLDVIVLANVNALNEQESQRLEQWVQKGMGLWFTAGSRIDAKAYNQHFDALLPLLLRSGSSSSDPALRLRAPELTHPLFASFLDPSALLGGETRRLFLLEPGPKRKAKVALRFSNGAPALVTRQVGEGRVAWWSTSIDRAWTDLVLHPGFVPLVEAVLQWLVGEANAGASSQREVVPVGTKLNLSSTQRVQVQGPHPKDSGWLDPGQVFRPARVGLYQSSRGQGRHHHRFSAALDPKVGIPPRPSQPQASKATPSVRKAQSYQPVWAYLWPLIALALVSEGVLRMLRLRR